MALLAVLLALNATAAYVMAAPDNGNASSRAVGMNDSGFRSDVNGFGFQNYGENQSNLSIIDLTPDEMRRMFGDQVCASIAGGKCVLTRPAKRWMNEAIKAMGSGHCEGMAVLSDLIYYNQISPDRFGGNTAVELPLRNELLQREIGYWWVTQVTNPGGSKRVYESPNDVLDTLIKAFKDGQKATEWWVMGIYMPDGSGGHAITPFAVEDMGNGTSRIMVYDNNWPKDTRFVEVDRKSNTWRYQASINPDEPSTIYTGNASTKNLEIVSVSSRLGLQQCDFCDGGNGSRSKDGNNKGALSGYKNLQIWQNGKARTLVTDDHGRRIGYLPSGEFVNEIPNAEARNLRFGLNNGHSPIIFVPIESGSAPRVNVTISSTADNNEENKAETAIIAPGLALEVSTPNLESGEQQSIGLKPAEEGYAVSFSTNQEESPKISVDTNYREVTISGFNMDPEGIINIDMNPTDNTFNMSTIGNSVPGKIQIQETSIDKESGESSTFSSADIPLQQDDGLSLNFADSNKETGIPSLSITHENGATDEVEMKAISIEDLPDASDLVPGELPDPLDLSSGVLPDSFNMPDMNIPGSSDISGMPGAEFPGTSYS